MQLLHGVRSISLLHSMQWSGSAAGTSSAGLVSAATAGASVAASWTAGASAAESWTAAPLDWGAITHKINNKYIKINTK